MRRPNARARMVLLSLGVAAVFLVLGGKLALVQFVYGEELQTRAHHQYVAPPAHDASRGSVFFQEKDGERFRGATLKTGFLVAINPVRISDPEAAFEALSAILPQLDRDTFIARAQKEDDPYEEIAKRIDTETAEQIRAADIPGVRVHEQQWRYYPRGPLAAHVLGFVGFDGDSLAGRYGVEQYYDDTLAGGSDVPSVNFFAELFANIGDSVFSGHEDQSEEDKAGDVVLTVEPEVQRFVERELEATLAEWSASSGGAIVIRPDTGAITAMAARPAFDPNHFDSVEDYARFSNPLVESVFELGSIMKPLTLAIGLENDVITPDTTYEDRGTVSVNGVEIANYDAKGHGQVSMQTVLNLSLNTGAVYVQQKTGNEAFRTFVERLELDEETGIDIPNEVAGLMDAIVDGNNAVDFASASFGQSIAPTPIGMVRALSTLANGGMLVTPHVVDHIAYRLTRREPNFPKPERVFSEETAATVTNMLVNVVDTTLADGEEKHERHSIAAKTGTAQVAKPNGGGYYENTYLHSFFDYFPAYNPEFLVFFYIAKPDARYASQTLTAPVMNTTDFLINYYEIPPDR